MPKGVEVMRLTGELAAAAQAGGPAWGDRAHEVMGYGVFVIVLGGVLLGPSAQAVTDTEFRYSTNQRGYLMIPAAALVPSSNTSQYSRGGGFKITTTAVAQVCFLAPVHLPNGARLTALRTWYLRPANPDVFFTLLYRVGVPGALRHEMTLRRPGTPVISP